ncbi:MAG: hypothetical protein IKY83_12495 [Proteobacteria bacterium]|nr:hypothetical protein [Pseudomonadota bacterium]
MKLSNVLLGVMLGFGVPGSVFAQDSYEPISLLVRSDIDQARHTEQWKWAEADGLRLKGAPEYKNSFWVYPHKITPNGTLRASFVAGKRPDASLFYRASFSKDLMSVDGYSLSFDRQDIQIHRWDGGYAMPVTSKHRLKYLPKKVDVVIEMLDSHTDISVYDSEKQLKIGELQSDDAAYSGTETGYRVHRKQDAKSSLLGIDFKPSGKAYAGIAADPDAYVRQYSHVFVFSRSGHALPGLKACVKQSSSFIPHYEIYRCAHKDMMQLVNAERKLPDGYYWAGPRYSFTDSEFRKAALDMKCEQPMHCDVSKPLDPNRSAKDVDMIQAYLDAYASLCGRYVKHVRLEKIGRTYLGHEIRALVLSNSDREILPRVLFNGAHHGMELLANDMAFDVIEELCENGEDVTRKRYDHVLDNTEVWIIPTVNLDGNDLYIHVSDQLGRKNGRHVFSGKPRGGFPQKAGQSKTSAYYRYHPNSFAPGAGVDNNRNYPLNWGATGELSSSRYPRDYWYRGAFPGSEPENQAMMNLFHTEQFVSSISFHTVSTRILSPYSIDALENPPHEQDNAWQLALRMAAAAGIQVNGKPYKVVKNLYSVDGTDQDWFRFMFGTYAYLIEGPLHNPVGSKRRQALKKTRPAFQTFLDAAPKSVIVRVRDSAGNPLIASVRYGAEPYLNGERWVTRCQDGTHTMLCFGDQEVTVTLPDGSSQTKTAPCRETPTVVEFLFDVSADHINTLDTVTSNAEKYISLMGVDAYCDLSARACPHLPAHRYCLIEGSCVEAGKTQDDSSKYICDPIENNRGWTRR